MTEPQQKQQTDETQAPAEAPQAANTETAPAEKTAETQVAELKDQLLRALADAENTRRRAQKEREDTSKYAVSNFAREMLNVADNFRRALDATPKDNEDPALKNLIAGIDATERQLQAALERFGIKKLEPMNQPFDPNFHRAMAEIDDPNHPPGTVVQVLQAGYVIHDRLLREALVAVSKGAPQAAPKVDQSA
jgi:molecular chaperone GrpE